MHPLRALKAMAHDAVDATAELVREGNESAARHVRAVSAPVQGVGALVRGADDVRRVMTGGVLGSVKAINRLVERVSDMALDAGELGKGGRAAAPVQLRSDVAGAREWLGDAALGVLNAAVGDYLDASKNTLGIQLQLRVGDEYLDATSDAQAWAQACAGLGEHLCVFVHGLGATEWSWWLGSLAYHGCAEVSLSTQLSSALGADMVHVRYNTGCALQENGQRLAALLELLCAATPMGRLTLVGHSMGGLVVRHACHHAQQQGLAWGAHVRDVAYLGSPHEGAPLAAFGTSLTALLGGVDLPATRIISRILDGRSIGTKDLAAGMTLAMREQLPLACTHHFVFGTIVSDAEATASRLVGDILVRPRSASGGAVSAKSLDRQVTHHGGLWHHHLQNHPAVSKALIASICAGEQV